MNTNVSVINVNPGASTLGSLHAGSGLSSIRREVYKEGRELAKEKSGTLLRLAFGPMAMGNSLGKPLLVFRMLFGIGMILGGFMIGSELGARFCCTSVLAVVAGFMLIPGLLTRVSMSVCAVVFGYVGLESLAMPSLGLIELLLFAGCLAIAIAGPGKYSADAILRRKIFRMIKRRETRKLMDRRFSYQAMKYAEY